MGAFNIGVTTVINDDAAYVHESFSTVGVGTTENKKITEIDPIASGSAASNDNFGSKVAVGCGIIVVGVPGDDVVHFSTTYNNTGSADIFDLNGNELVSIGNKLDDVIFSDATRFPGDFFGRSVAVGSGRIVVGADGVNTYQGSAYIFDLDGNQLGIITASDGVAYDYFGRSLAVGSGRIVLGRTSRGGAIYIFDLNGNQLGIKTASDGVVFGRSVALGCGRIVVGAFGSAYILDLNGNELTKITASDGAYIGNSVAVGCGRIVVGASGHDVGINTAQGSAYIFDLNGNEIKKLLASDGVAYDNFGRSVAVGSGMIVVGTPGSTLSGVDITHAEIAYIYDLDGNNEVKISHSDRRDSGGSVAKDAFGSEVAVGCGRIVVGAPLNYGPDRNSGSAYIFNLPEDSNTYWERVLEEYRY
jgi:hypothetical protein